ncbi:MAG: hypothetical protein JXB07_11990 [Anaerolineae bacterium]|nr:hypothetical protein [Anaerolineae bacterium]
MGIRIDIQESSCSRVIVSGFPSPRFVKISFIYRASSWAHAQWVHQLYLYADVCDKSIEALLPVAEPQAIYLSFDIQTSMLGSQVQFALVRVENNSQVCPDGNCR